MSADLRITVGMAVCGRVEWAKATIQALNIYHPIVRHSGEIVVIDNAPEKITWVKGDRPCPTGTKGGRQALEDRCGKIANVRYVPYPEKRGTAAPRQKIFDEARGEIVLVLDAHVFVMAGAIERLVEYLEARPDCLDLLQGPWLYDWLDATAMESHMEPHWRAGMFGTWACDYRARNDSGEPFDIPAQGLGLFACRREAWLGFNPHFREFGGEEGYIHEKFRRAGRRTLCCPWLRWWHEFQNTEDADPYPRSSEAMLWNYLVGAAELGLPDDHPMSAKNAIRHYCEELRTVKTARAMTLQHEANAVMRQAVAAPPPALPVQIVAAAGDDDEPAKPSELPLVFCLMMTHGRASTARQSIECFLRQDYPRKRLIILNTGDKPVMTDELKSDDILEMHLPNLMSEDRTIPTLDHLCLTLQRIPSPDSLIHFWDDDDLYLPWAISQAVANLPDDKLAWKPTSHWFSQSGVLRGLTVNACEASAIFRYEAFDGWDGNLVNLLRQLMASGQVAMRDVGPWTGYVYRFGISPDHFSGLPIPETPEEMQERLRYYRSKNTDFDGTRELPSVDETFLTLSGLCYPWTAEMQMRLIGDLATCHAGQMFKKFDDPVDAVFDARFPDRTNLTVCEVGRTMTARLAQHPKVRQVWSIDPDHKTIIAAQAECGEFRTKVKWRAEVGDCKGCQGMDVAMDAIFLNQRDPLAVLRAFRSLQTNLSGEIGIVCVPDWKETGAAILLRNALEPQFTAVEVGQYLVFRFRELPEWLSFEPRGRPL